MGLSRYVNGRVAGEGQVGGGAMGGGANEELSVKT